MATTQHNIESTTKTAAAEDAVACAVDGDEIQAARKDPKVLETLREARAYGRELERDGRVHP